MGPLDRRSCLGLLAGSAVALAAGGPRAAGAVPRQSHPGWGLLGGLAGTAYHLFMHSSLTSELIEMVRLWEWDTPGRMLTLTTVSAFHRDTIFLTRQADGSIIGTWGDTPVRAAISGNRIVAFEYQWLGMAMRGYIERLGQGRYREYLASPIEVDHGDGTQLALEEGRLIAARLLPAEYAAASTPAEAGTSRAATVIGISAYGTLRDLPNCAADARAVGETLRRLGFDVDLVLDADLEGLRGAVDRLYERGGADGSRLLYFAGHGLQSRGENYLLPARAQIQQEGDIPNQALSADFLLGSGRRSETATTILILDACRDTPTGLRASATAPGLAHILAPSGSYIAYSTAPGMVAADGDGAHSPFAEALLAELEQPHLPVEALFRNVRRAVLRATDNAQTPWDSSSLVEPFFLHE